MRIQGNRMCQAVFVEVPETWMRPVRSSPLHTPLCFILCGEVTRYDFSHSPGPSILWQTEILSGLELMFSEVLIHSSQPPRKLPRAM